jgi:ubiquinone/menaquinone biosynthesis C-methylase UbiE
MSGFTNVDLAADPRSFVRHLDQARSTQEILAAKLRTFEMLKVKLGDHALDVGCGTGDDARALAKMVGKAGRVVGVDSSKTMVLEARRRARGLNLPLEFRLCDAHRLDFADKTFDACRADRVFMHLEDPRQALSEMVRVARQGARILVTEPDWETLVMASDDEAVADQIVKLIRSSIRQRRIAHYLPSLFKELGLLDVSIGAGTILMNDYQSANQAWRISRILEGAQTMGAVSARVAARWVNHLEHTSQAGRFFSACTGFGVVGTKR